MKAWSEGVEEERTNDIKNINQIRVILVCPSTASWSRLGSGFQVAISMLLLTSEGLEGGDACPLPKAWASRLSEICGVSSGSQLLNVDIWRHGG